MSATRASAPKAGKPAAAKPKAKNPKKPATARAPKRPPIADVVEPPMAPEAVRITAGGADADQTAKAEVLALLAESERSPAQDAIEIPTHYDVLPSLYAKLEALVRLAETGPPPAAPVRPVLATPEAPTFDPFDVADLAEQAPFDPPDESDLCSGEATTQDYAEFAEGEPEHATALFEELAPVRAATPVHRPPDRAYLERARRAARDQTAGQPQPTLLGIPVEQLEKQKWRIAGAAAAPLLALGAWALYGQSDRAVSPVAPTIEAAPSASALIGEYRLAMRRLESGRARDGVALLRNLANAGFPMAQYQLAKVLERGEGATQSLTLARHWTERAANAGNCRAMHDVGVFYARGEGVTRDEAMAARWFQAAAERGVADSQYNLGILFEQGRGVALDPKEALFWFMVAARNRDLNAIDRAVSVAAGLSATEVNQIQARARSFQARAADPIANGAFEGGAPQSCAAG